MNKGKADKEVVGETIKVTHRQGETEVKKNPKSNALYFKELYKYNKSLYTVYGYILFSIYSKLSFKKIYQEHEAKFKILILYIPTLIISWIRK